MARVPACLSRSLDYSPVSSVYAPLAHRGRRRTSAPAWRQCALRSTTMRAIPPASTFAGQCQPSKAVTTNTRAACAAGFVPAARTGQGRRRARRRLHQSLRRPRPRTRTPPLPGSPRFPARAALCRRGRRGEQVNTVLKADLRGAWVDSAARPDLLRELDPGCSSLFRGDRLRCLRGQIGRGLDLRRGRLRGRHGR
jgi:hypothetical protein